MLLFGLICPSHTQVCKHFLMWLKNVQIISFCRKIIKMQNIRIIHVMNILLYLYNIMVLFNLRPKNVFLLFFEEDIINFFIVKHYRKINIYIQVSVKNVFFSYKNHASHVLILDGNSLHLAHACRKMGLFG